MIRNLLIISGAGLVLAIVGIGGSLAVGGADLARHSWTWVIREDDSGGLNIRRTVDDDVAIPRVTRQIAWSGQDRLTLSLPGDVLYIQTAEAPGITLSGPQALVDRVSFTNGQLLLSDHSRGEAAYVTLGADGLRGWSDSDGLKVTIRAPSVKTFELSDRTELEVRGYDQPTMNLMLAGSAEVEAQGRTDTLTIDASGSSSAELDELLGADATIRVSGSSGVKTAANGLVVVDGSGTSRVRLTRRPSELRQTLSGEAVVRQD